MHHIATELDVRRLTGFGRILSERIRLSVTTVARMISLSTGQPLGSLLTISKKGF